MSNLSTKVNRIFVSRFSPRSRFPTLTLVLCIVLWLNKSFPSTPDTICSTEHRTSNTIRMERISIQTTCLAGKQHKYFIDKANICSNSIRWHFQLCTDAYFPMCVYILIMQTASANVHTWIEFHFWHICIFGSNVFLCIFSQNRIRMKLITKNVTTELFFLRNE